MKPDAIRHFLLVYDAKAKRVEVQDLGDDAWAAAARYAEVEESYRGRDEFEVVLIGADSIETIRTTHAHYFDEQTNGDAFSVESRLLASVGESTA
jgi:hypothetical protein